MNYKMKDPSPMLLGGLFSGVLSMQLSPFVAIMLGGLVSSFVTFLLKACEPIVREWGEAKAQEMREKRANYTNSKISLGFPDTKCSSNCNGTSCPNCNPKNNLDSD